MTLLVLMCRLTWISLTHPSQKNSRISSRTSSDVRTLLCFLLGHDRHQDPSFHFAVRISFRMGVIIFGHRKLMKSLYLNLITSGSICNLVWFCYSALWFKFLKTVAHWIRNSICHLQSSWNILLEYPFCLQYSDIEEICWWLQWSRLAWLESVTMTFSFS